MYSLSPLPFYLSSQGRVKDELLALSAELSTARAESSRVSDSFVKRGDLEDRLKALSKENQELERQVRRVGDVIRGLMGMC